jgi:hypothetical protein
MENSIDAFLTDGFDQCFENSSMFVVQDEFDFCDKKEVLSNNRLTKGAVKRTKMNRGGP